jgi:hypothetical protein
MGGFVFDGSSNKGAITAEESASKPSIHTHKTVDRPKFATFIYIMKHFPHVIPDISEEVITDRAESSSLSKAVLIFQVGWFCTSCASRLIQHLPLSLLEVSTAAHAFCTLLTYFVWWSKPFNVAEGTPMRGKEAQEVHALLMCSDMEYSQALDIAEGMAAGHSPRLTNSHKNDQLMLAAHALQRLLPNPEKPPADPFYKQSLIMNPGANMPTSLKHAINAYIVVALSPVLYGLIHFLARSEYFPTRREYLLWQISSAIVAGSGLLIALVSATYKMLESAIAVELSAQIAMIVISSAHVLSSGFLIGESFRQLFFLVPAAYQLPSWSNYWPHFSI